MNQQQTLEKQPMPLPQFLSALKELAQKGRWKSFKEAVKKRKEWFESHGLSDKF